MAGRLKQGLHPDPLTQPPAPADWSARHVAVRRSVAMARFREGLIAPGTATVREGVVADLAAYYGMPGDEVVRRCVAWEEWCVEEWKSARATGDPLGAFYQNVTSWNFDLMWYAYLQSEGCEFPVSVGIVDSLSQRPGKHLDFGAGVGTTSQLFASYGWDTVMADISMPLQEFARFRWKRRGLDPKTIDLNHEEIGVGKYDVITAIDTLHHVPDLDRVLPQLHAALKPGGLLFANFEPRPATDENALHLYTSDLPVRWKLHRVGFEPEESIEGLITRYRKVEPRGLAHQLRGGRDLVLLRSPLRPAYRRLRYHTSASTAKA